MWPKVLTQLIELLPHASRLLPLAERYFQGKGEVTARLDEDSRAALQQARAAVTDLEAELKKRAASQDALVRQLHEQSAQMTVAVQEARATRSAVEAIDRRLVTVEQQASESASRLKTLLTTLIVLAVLMLCVLGLCLRLLFEAHR